jgi:hypothetical protein
MISPLPRSNDHAVALAGADISPTICTYHDSYSDRVMDPDEQRDYADQGPPSDSDLDGDTQIHLLKPARVDVLPGQPNVLCNDDYVHPSQPAWLEYPFRRVHSILRWLPSKLATWIGENFGQELCIPPKQGLKWTVGELNAILENNLVT